MFVGHSCRCCFYSSSAINKMKCSVISCKSKVKFKFPSNKAMKKKWLKAIGRSTFVPHTRDGLCNAHSNPSDIITKSYTWTIKTTTTTVSDERWL